MADNIAVTAGSGTTIATDEISSVHYQKVKLAIGAADSATLASGGAGATDAGTLRVALASDSAGVQATAAHDAADTGDPVKIGFKATASLAGLTPVAEGDRTNAFADLDGALIVRDAPLGDLLTGVASITDGSSTSVISAQGAGVKIYVTGALVSNSSASFVTVDIRDGTAGSVKATIPAPATGGAAPVRFASPIALTANTAAAADPSASASTITVTLFGFKSKV